MLLVDDDADDADLVRLAFGRHHACAQLEVAHDPHEALHQLTDDGRGGDQDSPAVVLLDLKLRGVCGFEILRRIRGNPRTAGLPVVVLTSSVEPRDVAEAYAAGANAYLRKPDSLEELVEMVGVILRFWVRCNQAPGRRAFEETR